MLAGMSTIVASCKDVSKSFALIDAGSVWRAAFSNAPDIQRFRALTDITFDVPKGQFVGVLGHNGAGKSTLLRTIGGVYPADKGVIVIKGSMSGLYELGLVGHSQLTGRAYADRLLTVHGFGARQRAEMIADIHDFSELDERFDDPVQTYSAGMGARLFFATATAGQYEFYLLDEVLAVGDQHFQAKCWKRLQDRIAHGASGILVTHDWSSVIKLCANAHVLDHGKVIFSGPSERASRVYLYGKDSMPEMRTDIARIAQIPASPIACDAGSDFELSTVIEILKPDRVRIALIVEQLQPGFGWETIVMTRTLQEVGHKPGRYTVNFAVPRLPLAPGSYALSLQLVAPDPELEKQNINLDSRGWLTGNGLELVVTAADDTVLMLPCTWSLDEPARVPAE
jgi:lipopolysaccharide transport system ATP-binding protein